MDLDHDACYRAVSQRDPRFDGRFFTGVKTTGIYCRPICPARTPRSENVIFFPTAAAAQEAGFRPCLRCRPETAPDLGAWRGTSNTVSRALALIELGALDDASVDDLAARLGVGERQLRRLFHQHLGASPIAVAQTRRVLLAKQLIHESSLSLAVFGVSMRPSRRCSGVRPVRCAGPWDVMQPPQRGARSSSCCVISRPMTGPRSWPSCAAAPFRASSA
jgi:AraC family transcriptional regulator of adaptative response / DNA-3-methyladenine glycosylase II